MFLQFIIPYYGSADLLITAVNSVLNQTDTNDIGLIVIDDNHQDTEGLFQSNKVWNFLYEKTADVYNHVFIKYLKNKQNLGVGPTRNKGLKSATAEYIAFLDSDDEIDKDFVSFFREKNNIHHPNIFVGRYMYDQGDAHVIANQITWLHAKVYKLSFLRYNHILFPPIRFNEDAGFNLMTYEMTKNIYTAPDDKTIYFWKQNDNSLTKTQNKETYSVEHYTKAVTFAIKRILKKYPLNQTTRLPAVILQLYYYYCELLYKNESPENSEKEIHKFFQVIKHTEWYNIEKIKQGIAAVFFINAGKLAIIPEITLAQFVSKFETKFLNFR